MLKNEKFDIIFLDAPYKTDFGIDATKIIIENEMLSNEGLIIFETDRKEEEYLEELQKYADIKKIKKYGRVTLVFLWKE